MNGLMRFGVAASLVLLSVGASQGLPPGFVLIGDAGNHASGGAGGDGAVKYEFGISKYEVTNSQYTQFLNAKAAADPFSLFNPSMMADPLGGISRTGGSGTFSYAAKPGYESKPVVFVSALDAARFVNWMSNGQGGGDTETGAYNLNASGSSAARSSSALFWVPTPDEWYKAAYYQPFINGGDVDDYWAYPTATNTRPTVTPPNTSDPNSGNFDAANSSPGSPSGINYLTNVGAYSLAKSYYGTFDQGGNVWEWTWLEGTSSKLVIGGSWNNSADFMRPGTVNIEGASTERGDFGFRIATVPEPTGALLICLGNSLLMVQRRRRRFGRCG